jgi:hypothetical protein
MNSLPSKELFIFIYVQAFGVNRLRNDKFNILEKEKKKNE